MKNSICNKCSSCGYCANRESGMMACINFNKFPKETGFWMSANQLEEAIRDLGFTGTITVEDK